LYEFCAKTRVLKRIHYEFCVKRATSILSNTLQREIQPTIETEIGLSPGYRGSRLRAFDKKLI
jgi:hypothetical protein